MSNATIRYPGLSTQVDIISQQPSIENLIGMLGDHDVIVRKRAHTALVHCVDHQVIGLLVEALNSTDHRMRMEAACVLRDRADPGIGPYLIEAMDDSELDVRWVAAEGLIALGDNGLELVLEALTTTSWENKLFHDSARHVIRAFFPGRFKLFLELLIEAMESIVEPAVSVPLIAHGALQRIRRANHKQAGGLDT